MAHINRHALVPHTPEQMFDLVNDVEAYPRRFPWCADARVLERDEHHLVARLDLRFAGMVRHFTTRNTPQRPHRIGMHFVDGPFRTLSGEWTFAALGVKTPSSGPADHLLPQAGEGKSKRPAAASSPLGCKVALALDFEVVNWLSGAVLGIGFQKLADQMVDDFCAEADKAYA